MICGPKYILIYNFFLSFCEKCFMKKKDEQKNLV